MAETLLEAGWSVVITGRSAARLEEAEKRLSSHGDRLRISTGDAGSDPDVRRWVDESVRWFGRLDVVVSNAGFAAAWLDEGDPDEWRDMVLTNVLGPALLIHRAQDELRRTKGRVVLGGSVAGLVPTPGNLYGATKYAVTGLAENVRRAFSHDEVGVTLIAPGRVESPFWDRIGGKPDTPMLATADIARAVAWVLDQPAGVDVVMTRACHPP